MPLFVKPVTVEVARVLLVLSRIIAIPTRASIDWKKLNSIIILPIIKRLASFCTPTEILIKGCHVISYPLPLSKTM